MRIIVIILFAVVFASFYACTEEKISKELSFTIVQNNINQYIGKRVIWHGKCFSAEASHDLKGASGVCMVKNDKGEFSATNVFKFKMQKPIIDGKLAESNVDFIFNISGKEILITGTIDGSEQLKLTINGENKLVEVPVLSDSVVTTE